MPVYDRGLGSRLFDALLIVFMLAVVFITLFPFYHITIVSLSNGNAVLRGEAKLLPVQLTLQAYDLVLKDPNVPRSLMNSVLYTVLGTTINLLMTALCAYPLASPRFSGRTLSLLRENVRV